MKPIIFYSFAEVQALSGNVLKFTEYYALLQSTDVTWKRMLRVERNNSPTHMNLLSEILVSKHVSADVYVRLIDNQEISIHKKTKVGEISCIRDYKQGICSSFF